MYIVMELDRQKNKFDNILKVILSIDQSTLYGKKIQSKITLSLIGKNLRDLAWSLDMYGVPFLLVTSTDEYASWYQSICRGQRQINKILGLKKKDLTTSIQITPNMKSKAINDHVSIGSAVSTQELTKRRKTDAKYPNIFLWENDKLIYLSTLLSSTELIGNHSVKHRMVVIPKSRYEYRLTSLEKDDLIQMELAKLLLLKITCCNGKLSRTRCCKRLKNSHLKQQWRLLVLRPKWLILLQSLLCGTLIPWIISFLHWIATDTTSGWLNYHAENSSQIFTVRYKNSFLGAIIQPIS